MKAKDLLSPGETAIAIFTHGDHLEINADGNGHTGIWVIDPKKDTDRVIIYWRRKFYPGVRNEIYIADRTVISESEHERRYVIHFSNARLIGETELTWKEFSEGGQNPVKYIYSVKNHKNLSG